MYIHKKKECNSGLSGACCREAERLTRWCIILTAFSNVAIIVKVYNTSVHSFVSDKRYSFVHRARFVKTYLLKSVQPLSAINCLVVKFLLY